MASQGPNSPGTAADDSGTGSIAWTNPSNSAASDNSYASASLSSVQSTHYLKVTNFGFSIPTGATIDGILVEVERQNSATGNSVKDNAVRAVKGGTIGSTDKSSTSNWPSSDSYASYGGSTDLWGDTWTISDVNASDFGAAISAKYGSGVGSANAKIDHIRITVYYTEGPVSVSVSESITITDNGVIGIAGSESALGSESFGDRVFSADESMVFTESFGDRVFSADESFVFTESFGDRRFSTDESLVGSESATLGDRSFTVTDSAVGSESPNVAQTVTESETDTDTQTIGIATSDPLSINADTLGDRKFSADDIVVLNEIGYLDRGITIAEGPLTFSDAVQSVGVYGTESAVGSTPTPGIAQPSSDSLVGSEATTVTAAYSVTGNLVAAEAVSSIVLVVSDSETGSDSATLKAALIAAENLVESSSVAAPNASVAGSDSLVGSESPTVGVAGSETVTAADSAALAAAIPTADALRATDGTAANASLTASDAVLASESPVVGVTGPQPLVGTDTAIESTQQPAAESLAVSTSAGGPAASVPASQPLTGSESAGVAITASQALVGTEIAATGNIVTVAEAESLTETTLIAATHAVSQGVVLSDTGVLGAAFPLGDVLIGNIVLLTSAQLAAAELIVTSDSSAVAAAVPTTQNLVLSELPAAGLNTVIVEPLVFGESVQPVTARIAVSELAAIAEAAAAPIAVLVVSQGMTLVEVGTVVDTTLRMLMVQAIELRPALGGQIIVNP